MKQKQIIAMGGGGFSMESNPALDCYLLKQSHSPKPKVCFIPTASRDAYDYIIRFYSAFSQLECAPSHLSFWNLPTKDLDSFLKEKDILYVGGGNTRNMLAIWREWELDRKRPAIHLDKRKKRW